MLKLEELEVYQLAMKIGDIVWNTVDTWNYFAKDAFGKQWIRATDSIALNIAEGYGRYFYKENKQFCYYARGSLKECLSCNQKAFNRKLLDDKQMSEMNSLLELLSKKLNNYIKSIGKPGSGDSPLPD